jgi:hypothetical protein
MVCSTGCAEAIARADKALQSVVQQTVRSAQANAIYCYLCAGLSAGGAVLAWFMLPSPFLIFFCGGCAVVLVLSGLWYTRAGKKQTG